MSVKWHGILAPLDKPTGDRRILVKPQTTDLTPSNGAPLHIRYQPADWGEHNGAVSVGSIDRVWIENGNVMGEGRFDTGNPLAVDVMRKIREGFAGGVSLDLDSSLMEAVCVDADGNVVECPEDPENILARHYEWRVRGATLVDIPAFAESYITVDEEHDGDEEENWDDEYAGIVAAMSGVLDLPLADRDRIWDEGEAKQRLSEWATNEDGTLDGAKWGRAFFYRDPDTDPNLKGSYKLGFADIIDGELKAVPRGIYAVAGALRGARGGVNIPEDQQQQIRERVGTYYQRMAKEFDDNTIVAPWEKPTVAAGLWPAEWFTNPQFDQLQETFTITEDGRIYGHAAKWDACHTGLRDMCMTAPHSAMDYSLFNRTVIETTAGLTSVGRITTGYGKLEGTCGHDQCSQSDDHACPLWSINKVFSHHDSMETAAYVVAGEDDYGIWFSGVLAPSVTPGAKEVLARKKVSGHWMNNGELVEILALAVREPGFPTRAHQIDGKVMSLVAAGHIVPATPITGLVAMASTSSNEILLAVDKAVNTVLNRRKQTEQLGKDMRAIRAHMLVKEMKNV